MGKAASKGVKGAPNKKLQARVLFLHQAATYIALQTNAHGNRNKDARIAAEAETAEKDRPEHVDYGPGARMSAGRDCLNLPDSGGLALHLSSHLRQVSRKSVFRVSSDIKRATCKTCSTPLVEGRTSETAVENLSKGRRKRWADVLVVTCKTCGTNKRFPVGAARQKGKNERTKEVEKVNMTKELAAGTAGEQEALVEGVEIEGKAPRDDAKVVPQAFKLEPSQPQT